MSIKEHKRNVWLIWFAGSGLLFLYIILRANSLSFTHDEALSYTVVKLKNYFEFTANNHQLNTWLMAFCANVFGESEMSLRLPNVLLFGVYLFFCFRIILKSGRTAFVLFAIPLLFLNPFVLDFFSLARGYGLSLGFMAASLYYFLRRDFTDFSHQNLIRDFCLAMLFATPALFANLALINFYIALLVIFTGNYFLFYKKNFSVERKKHIQFIGVFILSCIPLLIIVKRLLIISKAGDLYVGTDSFHQSISSFIERSSYFIPYPIWFVEKLQIFIELIFPIGLIITLIRKKITGPVMKVGILIMVILTGIYLEHYLFEALFPWSRTGVYFIPLFGFFIFYLFIQFIEGLKPQLQKVLVAAGLLLVTLPLTIHFLKTINLVHTFEWKYEAHTKDVVEEMAKKNRRIVLGYDWIFGPAINYYVQSKKLNIVPIKLEEGKPYDQDFVYEFKNQLKDSTWTLVKSYEDIGSGLYKNSDK